MTLSIDDLRSVLDYEPSTGALTWRARPIDMFSTLRSAATWNAKFSGKPALTANCTGYRRGSIFGRSYLAHRVAWAMHYGEWPADQIDHANGVRSDNRISNLRSVTSTENGRNQKRHATNSSGVTGVSLHGLTGKWRAQIKIGGRDKHLGLFPSFDAAVAARKSAERESGYHPNHGRTK